MLFALAQQGDEGDFALAQRLQIVDGAGVQKPAGSDGCFGDVIIDLEQIRGGGVFLLFAFRQQPPADQDQIGEADDGDRQPHRRIIKHAKGFAGRIAAKTRDDHIGRRADQRHQSAEQRCETDRHQQF